MNYGQTPLPNPKTEKPYDAENMHKTLPKSFINSKKIIEETHEKASPRTENFASIHEAEAKNCLNLSEKLLHSLSSINNPQHSAAKNNDTLLTMNSCNTSAIMF